MTLHKVIVIMCSLIIFSILVGSLSSIARGKTSANKPYNQTQCFKRTVPNFNMWHAASCKGRIDRHSGEPYVYSKM